MSKIFASLTRKTTAVSNFHTVQLWSTKHYDVVQTGQSRGTAGRVCTRVTTFRERTDPEGRVLEDSVFATYRPGEGIDCNGNPTPQPNL